MSYSEIKYLIKFTLDRNQLTGNFYVTCDSIARHSTIKCKSRNYDFCGYYKPSQINVANIKIDVRNAALLNI